MSRLSTFHAPDDPVKEEAVSEDKPTGAKPVPWQIVWAMIAFLGGTLFSAGMGWGRSSTSLDNIAISISRLEGEVSSLTDKYTVTDKATSQELQKIEDHLTYDDSRLDRLESAGPVKR